jgi:predicted nucleotide-binding protein
MAKAQAIVVIFTPDDEAQLKSAFVQIGDGPHETQLTGQARQNVILEAGMALEAAPERTVLVRLGQTRPISDIEGINWIDLGDTWDNRERLRAALANANVALEPNRDLVSSDAGTFTGIDLG